MSRSSKEIPCLPEVESAVLGYCFADGMRAWSTLVRMSDNQPESLFYGDETRLVASAISKTVNNEQDWNESSIQDTLSVLADGDTGISPRETTLALQMNTGILSEQSFSLSVKRLVEKRTMRKILSALETSVSKIMDAENPPSPDDINKDLSHVMMNATSTTDIKSMGEVIDELESVEAAPWVIPTGVGDLDKALGGGYQPGRLYVIAAETKIGKTTLAMNSAVSGLENDASVVFLSMETLNREFYGKMLATEGFLPQKKVVDYVFGRIPLDDFEPDEQEDLLEARQFLKDSMLYPLFPDSVHGGFFSTLTAAVMSAKSKHGMNSPSMLVVDHLQLTTEGLGDDRAELERNTKGLKRLATDMEIPVLLLSQLNRDTPPGEMPGIRALRGSGAIAADADAVIMLNRKGHYDDTEPDHILDISVPIARMGTPSMIQAMWDGERNTITDLDAFFSDDDDDDDEE